jgi:putative flippase GtrA
MNRTVLVLNINLPTLLYTSINEVDWKTMRRMQERIKDVRWTHRVMLYEFLKFNIAGTFNFLFALALYEVLYWVDLWPAHTAVAAWAVSSTIGNVEAHFMHYKFTFKSTFSYFRSLNRAFWTYTAQLVVTTLSHYFMVEVILVHHRIAWLVNTCVFGFINFLLIRWIAFPPEYDQKNMLNY